MLVRCTVLVGLGGLSVGSVYCVSLAGWPKFWFGVLC